MPSVPIEIPSAKVQVAGAALGPGVDHRDQGLLEIGRGEAGGLEHRARRSAIDAAEQTEATHGRPPSSGRNESESIP
jgi:hypothetical protein